MIPYALDATAIILSVAGVGLLLSAVHALVLLFRKQHFLPRDRELRRRLARTQTVPNPKPQRLRKPNPSRPPPPQFFYVDIESAAAPPPATASPTQPAPPKKSKSKPSAEPLKTNDRGLSVDDEFLLRIKRDLSFYDPPNADTQALKLKIPPHVHGRLPNCRRAQYISDIGIDPASKDENDNDDISLVSDDNSEVAFDEIDPEGKRATKVQTTSPTLLKLLAMPADLEDAPTTEQERPVANVVIKAEDKLFVSLRNTKMK
uniref:Uncharacterized protein n=1 Tax=Panagrellus redivivus TaxID=6233 RepID=A0A7E4VHB8_PANRE